LTSLSHKKVAVLGYGEMARLHAIELRERQIDVVIGLRESDSWEQAEHDGFQVYTLEEAVDKSTIIRVW